MQSVRLVLPDATFERLAELAHEAYRSPRQHAAVILVGAIDRAGKARRPRRSEKVEPATAGERAS